MFVGKQMLSAILQRKVSCGVWSMLPSGRSESLLPSFPEEIATLAKLNRLRCITYRLLAPTLVAAATATATAMALDPDLKDGEEEVMRFQGAEFDGVGKHDLQAQQT